MPKVLHRERAVGVRADFADLLDDWERDGTHDVVIPPDGGLRLDEANQAAKAAIGLSAAKTLRSTPHGRGAALDVWPRDFLAHVPVSHGGTARRWTSWEKLPAEIREQFAAFGRFAEVRRFKWGGRWVSRTFPNGDQPHVELPNWQALPFPPREEATHAAPHTRKDQA